MEDKRRYGLGSLWRKWFPDPETEIPVAPSSSLTGKDFSIQVKPSDLYDLSSNLIEHLVLDEEQTTRELAAEAEVPGPALPAPKSKFLSMVLDEVNGLGRRFANFNQRVESVEKTGSDLEGKLSGLRDQLAALQVRQEKAAAVFAEREETSELQARLEGLSSRFVTQEELDRIQARLDRVIAQEADRGIIDELALGLTQVNQAFAEQGKILERLATQFEELPAPEADRELWSEVNAELAKVRSEAADGKVLERVRAELERIGRNYVDQAALDRISGQLEELRKTYTGSALLDKVIAHVEVIGSGFAERAEVNRLLDRLEELASKSAERAELAEANSRIEEISASAANRESLEQLAREVAALPGRLAEKKALAQTQAQLEALDEKAASREETREIAAALAELSSQSAEKKSLEQTQARVEALDHRAAGRDEVQKISAALAELRSQSADKKSLEQALSRLEELAQKSADRQEVSALAKALKEFHLAAADRESLEAVSRKLEELQSRQVERSALDQVLAQVKGLEAELAQVRETGPAAPGPPPSFDRADELESRLSGFEQRLAELRAAPVGASAEAIGTSEGLAPALSRISKLEEEHQELRRQIRKAFENLTNNHLRDLEKLKKRLEQIDKSRAYSASIPRGPEPVKAALSISWSKLLLFLIPGLLIAISVGAFMGNWLASGGSPGQSGKAEAPNIVYDDLKIPLSSPTLDLGTDRVTLQEGKLDVTGNAPGAVKASLYVNGIEVAHQDVANDEFSFPAVALEYGPNVLAVKAVDLNGKEANSMACLVERASAGLANVLSPAGLNRMRGPRQLPFLALTIDAGSTPRRAEKILDLLREKKIVTTFFLTGRFIEENPDIARRIVADGHEVGNHTYNHPHLTSFEQSGHNLTGPGVTREKFQDQLQRTRKIFEDATGTKMSHWWRAPYGEYNQTILGWANEIGFQHIDWTRSPQNLDMLDWIADPSDGHYLDHSALLKRLTGIDGGVPGRANGSIILMHLGTDREKDFMDEVLPAAIEILRGRKYQFVTVSRMFEEK